MGSWDRVFDLEHETLDEENYLRECRGQPYRAWFILIIEHKHFEYGTQPKTVITREYPADWKRGEPQHPINDEKNNAMFASTKKKPLNDKVIFCGRLVKL